MQGIPMTEIDHEKRNLLTKVRKRRKSPKPKVARAAIPGERERDLARLDAIKKRRSGKRKRSEKKHW